MGNNIMNNRFIRIGEQTFAINHITHVCRIGDRVEVRVVSCPEALCLSGYEATVFWDWHTSALNTITLHVPQESREPVALS